MPVKNIIFDLGAVLIDWNPKYVFNKIFKTPEATNHFLNKVCTHEWNEMQDGGRSIEDAETFLIGQFPEYTSEIKAFYGRWTEMLGGPIFKTVEILKKIKEGNSCKIFALTNWSAETWPVALERYEFLSWFEGIVVSGVEKMAKPNREIYELICNRYNLDPQQTIFIDDNERNIKAAQEFGLRVIHFKNSDQLERDLICIG
jgi:2-haloacid dehalogenase